MSALAAAPGCGRKGGTAGPRVRFYATSAATHGHAGRPWLPARRLLTLCIALAGSRLVAAEPPLVFIQNSPGRFEIAAADAVVAHRVAAATEELWRVLATPLGLPEAFTSSIFVRVVSAGPDAGVENLPFRVTVEVGGIVSIRIRADAAMQPVMRHALVQGLLMRSAVAHYGAEPRLTSPLWLEHACVEWWRTRADAAQLDALKQETARLAPPPLESLLMWRHGAGAPRASVVAAMWLLSFLQAESVRGKEWQSYLARLLGGEDPLVSLAASYPDRFATGEERELWWQTGYHHARRVRALPAFDAPDSRAQLASLARFAFAGTEGDADVVIPLRDVMRRSGEPVVAAEITRRAGELARVIPALHPFYRNAGLALGEAFAARSAQATRQDALCLAFERDWRDATEIEAVTSAALDRLEGRAESP